MKYGYITKKQKVKVDNIQYSMLFSLDGNNYFSILDESKVMRKIREDKEKAEKFFKSYNPFKK